MGQEGGATQDLDQKVGSEVHISHWKGLRGPSVPLVCNITAWKSGSVTLHMSWPL
jgi:hypothetical protein